MRSIQVVTAAVAVVTVAWTVFVVRRWPAQPGRIVDEQARRLMPGIAVILVSLFAWIVLIERFPWWIALGVLAVMGLMGYLNISFMLYIRDEPRISVRQYAALWIGRRIERD